ncbi:MAG: hypothetical protein WEB59_06385 [Thermoanaerobaculia bacterium]
METLTDVQARLAAMACPFCGERSLELRMQCDVHGEACVFVAMCESCSLQYLVDRNAPPSAEGASVTQLTCPRCGGPHCRLTFRCAVASRECRYEILCDSCPVDGAPASSVM